MNRLVRGSVILAAAAVSWACGGLDTDGIDETVELVADPSVVFVANTDSQAVFVEALNDLGQQLEGDFTVTNVGPGINVNYDTTFAPRPGVENLPTRVRYFVRASDPTSFVNSSFEVTANGVSLTIPVRITPANLSIALSNPTPALGEAVTLTAPANVRFTPASTVTVAGGVAVVSGISADSTQLTLLFGPGITDQTVTVSNIVVTYLPGQTFALATTGTVTTPAIASIPGTFSDAAPAVGDTVSLVLDPQYRALPTASLTFGTTPSIIVSISADSQTINFLPPPGSTGSPTLGNAVLSFLTSVPLSLPTAAALTVANTSNYTGTDDPATAFAIAVPTAVNDTVEFYDLSQFIDQFYTMNLAAGTYRLEVSWPGTGTAPDVDMFFANAPVSGAFCAGATVALPEVCSATVVAGSYRIYINLYSGAAPAWYRVRLIRTA